MLLPAPRVSAQAPPPPEVRDIRQQLEETQRQEAVQTEIERAAAAAKKKIVEVLGAEVTYEQVLADPDNIELNYRYAISQVAKGNLRAAAATLERILMIKSDLPKARLFYGVVLFRLDDLTEAERELTLLKKETMPDSLRSEIDDYLAQIRRRRSRIQYHLAAGLGFDLNDNRNAAPASGKRLFLDTPITLDSDSTHKTDTALTMTANAGFVHKLGFQAGHEIFANVGYYRAEQTHLETLNLQNYTAATGFAFMAPWLTITPSFSFNHLLLAEATYLRSREARLDLKRKLGRLNLRATTAYARLIFSRTPVVPTGPQRTGDKLEGGLGVDLDLTPSQKISLDLDRSDTNALEDFNSFWRRSASVGYSCLLGKGQFLLASAGVSADSYDEPDFFVSNSLRRDHTYRARATYGVPLTIIAKPLKDLMWTITYEYFQSRSNLISYSYTNNKVSTMLNYRLNF